MPGDVEPARAGQVLHVQVRRAASARPPSRGGSSRPWSSPTPLISFRKMPVGAPGVHDHAAGVDALAAHVVDDEPAHLVVADAAEPADLDAEPRQGDGDVALGAAHLQAVIGDVAQRPGLAGREQRHRLAEGHDVWHDHPSLIVGRPASAQEAITAGHGEEGYRNARRPGRGGRLAYNPGDLACVWSVPDDRSILPRFPRLPLMLVQSPRARAYLELVRLPNLFTAVGDIVAGYLVVSRGVDVSWGVLAILIASSVCFYAGGVVLNDYFDRDVDAVERPERPIPSGRIREGSASDARDGAARRRLRAGAGRGRPEPAGGRAAGRLHRAVRREGEADRVRRQLQHGLLPLPERGARGERRGGAPARVLVLVRRCRWRCWCCSTSRR